MQDDQKEINVHFPTSVCNSCFVLPHSLQYGSQATPPVVLQTILLISYWPVFVPPSPSFRHVLPSPLPSSLANWSTSFIFSDSLLKPISTIFPNSLSQTGLSLLSNLWPISSSAHKFATIAIILHCVAVTQVTEFNLDSKGFEFRNHILLIFVFLAPNYCLKIQMFSRYSLVVNKPTEVRVSGKMTPIHCFRYSSEVEFLGWRINRVIVEGNLLMAIFHL